MRLLALFFVLLPSLAHAVIDNEVRNLSQGDSSSGFGLFVAGLISLVLVIGALKLFLNIAWNGGVKRRVNIPNWPLHLRIANSILDYDHEIDINTWITREEYDLVNREAHRLYRLEQEDLGKYYDALQELEQRGKSS